MGHYYVFVRTDIPIGDQACQISHASALAGRDFQLPDGCNLVLIQVLDKFELLNVERQLSDNQIRYRVHDEPDDGIGVAALATEELTPDKRRILSRYRLWRGVQKPLGGDFKLQKV